MNAPTANRTLSALGSFSDTAEPLTQLFAGMYDSEHIFSVDDKYSCALRESRSAEELVSLTSYLVPLVSALFLFSYSLMHCDIREIVYVWK